VGWSDERLQAQSIQRQYFGWSIDRPTREISQQVYFPVTYKPEDYSHKVLLAPVVKGLKREEERSHENERERLSGSLKLLGPTGNRYSLVWHIDAPMLGLVYVIGWKPLGTPHTLSSH
jgi:hypothetical protein